MANKTTDSDDPRQKLKAARQQMRDAQVAMGQDPVSAISVALRASEFAELDRMATEHGGSRGSLMTVLMRYAMREAAAGQVPLKVNSKTRKFE